MKKITFALALSIGVAAMYSCNSNGTTDADKDPVSVAKDSNDNKEDSNVLAVTEDDSKFLVFAADAGMTEIEAGKFAKTQAISSKAKDFADMMIKDHTAAGDEVKSLAAAKNITLPAAVGEDHQKAIKDMSEKKGADFEKAYISMMVDDHQKVVDKFTDASQNCKDSEIKAFAVKSLPTMQAHLDRAKTLKDAMK